MLRGSKSDILIRLGESLRARRLSVNLSQSEAAERSGISLSTLKNLEGGKGASVWALVSLCRTYRYDQWILELAPDESLEHRLREMEGRPRQRAAKRQTGAAGHV